MTEPSEPSPTIALRVGDYSFEVEPDRIYILGSSEKADLRLRHGSVSPHHATFSLHRGEMIVEDLQSVTGTWTDGARVDRCSLTVGEGFRVGDIEIGIAAVATAPATAAAGAANPAFIDPLGLVSPGRTRHAWRPEETFAEIMATELRRAPWLTCSIVLHVLLLWLLYALTPEPELRPHGKISFLAEEDVDDDASFGDFTEPTEEVEVEEAEAADELDDSDKNDLASAFESDERFDEASEAFAADLLGPESAWDTRLRGGGGGDILESGGGGGLSKGFGRTVGEVRRSGLEIVFVFDSTGSMDPVLKATKKRLVKMLDVLHALVPGSRVGIVTYRDHRRAEEYVTREVPLDRDYYRALNFMQTVEARGGGDRPEAVFEGLQGAVKQKWRRGARRLIVLIGDAPAHTETQRKIKNLLRNFAADGRSQVHSIMTSPDILGTIEDDTRQSFEFVAKIGKGVCLPFEKEELILRQVMALAFGQEYRKSIDEVYSVVENRQTKVSARYRDVVRRRDAKAIEHELRRARIPDEMVRALATSDDKEVAKILLGFLVAPRFPEPGRHAAAWALQRILELKEPPIPLDGSGRISKDLASFVRRAIRHKS